MWSGARDPSPGTFGAHAALTWADAAAGLLGEGGEDGEAEDEGEDGDEDEADPVGGGSEEGDIDGGGDDEGDRPE